MIGLPAEFVQALPVSGLVLALLALGSAGHALALLALRRAGEQGSRGAGETPSLPVHSRCWERGPAAAGAGASRAGTTTAPLPDRALFPPPPCSPAPPLARLLAAVAQLLLLAALAGATVRLLAVNDITAWLPERAAETVQAAGWLALLIFLVAGYWWRSPGLGVLLPLLALAVLATGEGLRGAAGSARGLAIAAALRPVVAVVMAAALAFAALGLAGLLARALETRVLGQARFSRRAGAGLLAGAALLQTGLLALAAGGWLARPRGAPLWTVQQTWLVATWLVLLLAAEAGWRRRPVLPALAALGAGLLLVGLAVVAGVGLRA
jgi:hypothetical protein